MNEVHKDRLRLLASDDLTLDALKLLSERITEEYKPKNTDVSDERIGQEYRGYIKAKEIIESLLRSIALHKEEKLEENNEISPV